jgi:prepilin-type N-terminal cleavage/methylation domain-containing protein
MRTKYIGFTLVELLVVITIITVLASMLLPVLDQTINEARLISCSNNLKQINTGIMLYASDWNNYAPSNIPASAYFTHRLCGSGSSAQSRGPYNLGLLYESYLPVPQIYYCPSQSNPTYSYNGSSNTFYLETAADINSITSRVNSAYTYWLRRNTGKYGAIYDGQALDCPVRQNEKIDNVATKAILCDNAIKDSPHLPDTFNVGFGDSSVQTIKSFELEVIPTTASGGAVIVLNEMYKRMDIER